MKLSVAVAAKQAPPSAFVVWRGFEKSIARAAATWFAARSEDPAENLSWVRIVSAITKYSGGGAHVEFVVAEAELTLALLTRTSDKYQMVI